MLQNGPGNMWFADLLLSESATTEFSVEFESGAFVESGDVSWIPFNLLAQTSIVVRAGDSLRLTGHVPGDSSGTVDISVGTETNYNISVTAPVTHTFSTSGTFVLSAVHNGITTSTGASTVTVMGAKFPTNSVVALVREIRDWQCESVEPHISVDSDGGDVRIDFIGSAASGGSDYEVESLRHEAEVVVARAGSFGPVIDSAEILGARFFHTLQTYTTIVETYSDGSRLIEQGMVMSPVRDIEVVLDIIVSGVTFEDGTIQKSYTASDFDELGKASVRFLLEADVQTSNCHTISLFQDGVLIGFVQ